jgi:hypothetical protein
VVLTGYIGKTVNGRQPANLVDKDDLADLASDQNVENNPMQSSNRGQSAAFARSRCA